MSNFVKKNLISDEIVIGMGAVYFSMDERAKFTYGQDIQSLQKQFGKNLILNENLINTVGLIWSGPAEIF